jgi:nitroreductase
MTEQNDLTPSELLTTTRAIRRLRPDPVPVDILADIVADALCAPTASNRQNWRFIVVTDRELLRKLGELHALIYGNVRSFAEFILPESIFRSVEHMGDHFGEAGAVVLVGATEAPGGTGTVHGFRTWYAGVLPAAWSVILAARVRGLGATLTTTVLEGAHDEVRELLGVPDDVVLVAAIPLGYPSGRFGRPPRNPLHEVAHLDRWGTPLAAMERLT